MSEFLVWLERWVTPSPLGVAVRWLVPDWAWLDTWIVVTAALVAMSCALPGAFLVLRRQSMMGDALSHTVLPGIVVAFLFAHWLLTAGWVSASQFDAVRDAILFLGALLIGVLSAVLTEWVQRLGRVEQSAALGVVFTSLFALGLVMIRQSADQVHLDADCVLYGVVESLFLNKPNLPQPLWLVTAVFAANLCLVLALYKELKVSTFDPGLATTLGIPARWMHYGLMAITAATLVTAFRIVGSILVIAMLVTPGATAMLLTRRLSTMLTLSVLLSGLTAFVGHLAALVLPPLIFPRLGFPNVEAVSTTGMMAVVGGVWFALAVVCGPRYGLLSRAIAHLRLGWRIAREDLLGWLYRLEETGGRQPAGDPDHRTNQWPFIKRWALHRLVRQGHVRSDGDQLSLTSAGRRQARELVQSHRLWEAYLARHFALPDDHLHDSASYAEHFIDSRVRAELADELDGPARDPHGQSIPRDQDDS